MDSLGSSVSSIVGSRSSAPVRAATSRATPIIDRQSPRFGVISATSTCPPRPAGASSMNSISRPRSVSNAASSSVGGSSLR